MTRPIDESARYTLAARGRTGRRAPRRVFRCSRCGEPGHFRPTHPRRHRRIALDFAEPTLRAIHEALLDVLVEGGTEGPLLGDRLNLTLIAEQMVGMALGEVAADDPPLHDRDLD